MISRGKDEKPKFEERRAPPAPLPKKKPPAARPMKRPPVPVPEPEPEPEPEQKPEPEPEQEPEPEEEEWGDEPTSQEIPRNEPEVHKCTCIRKKDYS